MTQFASTLYPQTNPTNPILCEFRKVPTDLGSRAGIWARDLDVNRDFWAKSGYYRDFEIAQIDHARRVLTRLAALTG